MHHLIIYYDVFTVIKLKETLIMTIIISITFPTAAPCCGFIWDMKTIFLNVSNHSSEIERPVG